MRSLSQNVVQLPLEIRLEFSYTRHNQRSGKLQLSADENAGMKFPISPHVGKNPLGFITGPLDEVSTGTFDKL